MEVAVVQSVFIYSFLTLFMIYCARKASRYNKFSYMLVGLVLYSIIMGLRYGVGTDFFSYQNMYDGTMYGLEVEKEPGFVAIIKFAVTLGLGNPFCLFTYAFIQLFLIFKTFSGYKQVFPFMVITFMLSEEWLMYANVIRHMIAFAIFVYALKFIINRNLIKYLLAIALACLFHKSAAVLIVIYPIYLIRPSFFNKRSIQFILLGGSLVMMNLNFIQEFIAYFDKLIVLLGYGDKYLMDDRMDMEVSIGLGFLVEICIALTIIFFSPKVKLYFNSPLLNISYDLFFIGLLIKYSFIGSMLIQRMNLFFLGFTFIAAAFTMAYLFKTRKLMRYAFVCLYLLFFTGVMMSMKDNTALYVFNFQEQLYHYKYDIMK